MRNPLFFRTLYPVRQLDGTFERAWGNTIVRLHVVGIARLRSSIGVTVADARCFGRIVTVDHLVAVVEFDPSDHALAIGLFQLRHDFVRIQRSGSLYCFRKDVN